MQHDADWMDERIEAYLDGALPVDEQAAFERQLHTDATWDTELRLARQIRSGLRALPAPMCPPHVTNAVLAEVQRRREASRSERWIAWLERLRAEFWQPALAMSLLLVVVTLAAVLGRPAQPAPDPEVAQALAEVRWTLAYLSEVGRQTGESVRDQVIDEHVVQPVQRALGPLFQESADAPPPDAP